MSFSSSSSSRVLTTRSSYPTTRMSTVRFTRIRSSVSRVICLKKISRPSSDPSGTRPSPKCTSTAMISPLLKSMIWIQGQHWHSLLLWLDMFWQSVSCSMRSSSLKLLTGGTLLKSAKKGSSCRCLTYSRGVKLKICRNKSECSTNVDMLSFQY